MAIPKPHPYRLHPSFEQLVALLSASRSGFWVRVGQYVDPELLLDEPSKHAMLAVRAYARDVSRGPSSPLLVVQRLRRWMQEGKYTQEQVEAVNDMFDQAQDRGVPPEDDVVAELAPVLQRHVRDRAVHVAIESFSNRGSLQSVIDMEEQARQIGRPLRNEPLSIRLSDVDATPVNWLWPGRIAFGSLTVIDGDPGLGKSLLTLDIAARVSAQLVMPDSVSRTGACEVMLASSEDALASTVVPRLDAAGADRRRIHVVPSFSLPRDVSKVERLAECGVRFVVIDPLMAHLCGNVDSHRDQQIRSALRPLEELAGRTGLAVLVVRHLNKSAHSNALYRGGGSIGISAAARIALLAAKDPDDPTCRVLAPIKSNLGELPPSLSFKVVGRNGTAALDWLGPSKHDASALLAGPNESGPEVARAKAFLESVLKDGPVGVPELLEQAAAEGISKRTLHRAKDELGVRSRKSGPGWLWGAASVQVGTREQEGHLPDGTTKVAN